MRIPHPLDLHISMRARSPVPSIIRLQLILTGVSEGGKDEAGAVVFIDKRKHTLVRKVSQLLLLFVWFLQRMDGLLPTDHSNA